MKKLLLIIICIGCFIPMLSSANELVYEQYNELNLNEITDISADYINNDISVEDIADKLLKGENFIDINTLFGKILSMISKEVMININLVVSLVVLAIVCSILTNLQNSFENKGISEISFIACYVMFVILTVTGFYECANLAGEVINEQTDFMKMAIPTYISLMISTGNITVAKTMEPIFLFIVQFIGKFIEQFMLPVVFWISILSVLNNLSDRFHLSKLISFSKQTITWLLAGMVTFFVAVMNLTGITSSAVDGVAIRSMKYAVGRFVPVVGGILTDSVDTVITSTLVVKNAMGVLGVVVMILICITPILKLGVSALLFKITAGIIEPITDKRIVGIISNIAGGISLLFIMVFSVTIMFIISITTVIGFANITSMIK